MRTPVPSLQMRMSGSPSSLGKTAKRDGAVNRSREPSWLSLEHTPRDALSIRC